MSRRKKSKTPKPKRLTPRQQRAGTMVVNVEPTDLGPNYKTPPVRRHRGPSTAGAIPGTGMDKNHRRGSSG